MDIQWKANYYQQQFLFDIVLLLINKRQHKVCIAFQKMATQLNRKQKNITCEYDAGGIMSCKIVTKSDIDDSNIKADTHIQEEDTLYSMIKILI
jgi:hypothetical protein